MKISNSKKELARIISENGGWRNGEFAAQDSDGGIGGYAVKPKWDSLAKYWWREASGQWFLADKIKNHHQTVLSRAEYFHLYPAPDADGWIEWNGEPKSPVENGVLVDVKLKGGGYHEAELLDDASWSDAWGDESIIAYRLHKPEQALGELCGKVTEENRHEPVWTNPPSIEQLAADYRNAKDYAERKQQEADDAKADAETKLAELVAAGKAIGLVLSVGHEVSVITPSLPQLIAGDWRSWRQWEVGDLISWSIVGHIGEFRIISVHHDQSRNIGDFEVEDKHGGVYRVYGNECRFIRRP